jgi:putative addiction module killer protein/probable addiction module antidote protein
MFEVQRTDTFDRWLKGLKDSKGRTKIQARIDRLANGNPGDVGPIGEGLSELRIDFGPGYRVYYGRAGKTLYLLLCGGDKATQDADIKSAHAMWKVLNPPAKKAGQVGVTMATKPHRPKIKVARYDSADYLKTEEDIKNYLAAVFEEPMDRQMLIHTLGVVARARGMMKLAKETGITRAGLYKALSPKGNPSFETVAKIVGAFGMRLSAHTA